MEYKRTYSCWLYDEIKSGKKIFCLDRKFLRVVLVNDLTVDRLAALINSDNEEPTRYEFWYEEAEEATKETEDEEDD
jgi:hypothetical protein